MTKEVWYDVKVVLQDYRQELDAKVTQGARGRMLVNVNVMSHNVYPLPGQTIALIHSNGQTLKMKVAEQDNARKLASHSHGFDLFFYCDPI